VPTLCRGSGGGGGSGGGNDKMSPDTILPLPLQCGDLKLYFIN